MAGIAGARERLGRRLGWLEELPPEPVPLPLLRTSPAGFTIALSALIDRSEDIHSRPVLLTMPPLSQQLPAEARVLLNECPAYDARIRALAAKRGTPWVELTGPAPDGAFTVDGLHLTAAGQQLAADRVYETLEKAGLWAALAGRAR